MVIPPAKTGRDKTNKIAVKKILHKIRGIFSQFIRVGRAFNIVQRKLIDPPMEEAPAMWSLKIAKSTLHPGCPKISLMGG